MLSVIPDLDKLKNSAFDAINSSNLIALKSALIQGLNPNSKNSLDVSLLHLAVKKVNPQMVELLLQHHANPNITTSDYMFFTLKASNLFTSTKTFQLKEYPPLMTVLNEDKLPMEFERLNPKSKDFKAISHIVSALLSYGANVNIVDRDYGFSPLHLCANFSHPTLVKKLIEHGANVNQLALINDKPTNTPFKSNLTPMLIAANSQFKDESSDCIKIMLQNGGDFSLSSANSIDTASIIIALNSKYPELAEQIVKNRFRRDFSELEPTQVLDLVKEFIKENPKTPQRIDFYTSKLLNADALYNSTFNEVKHLTHLHSWNGTISYNTGTSINKIASEGWNQEASISKKIKHLLLVIKELSNSNIDCIENFNEPKNSIITKLSKEIRLHATSYITTNHIKMFSDLKGHLNSGGVLSDNTLTLERLKQYLTRREAIEWCKQINNLSPGETFAIAASSLGHAINIDYKKQNDGNITRVIYNLGGSNTKFLHPSSLEHKLYPSIAKDIPENIFRNFDDKAIEHLSKIIREAGTPHSDKSFCKNIYDDAYNINATPTNHINDFKGYIPMKYQISGNCCVKSNQAAIRNRLQNDKLYYFLKSFEIKKINETLNIPEKLHFAHEMDKDIANINRIIEYKENSPKAFEEELFRFLKKRSYLLPGNIIETPGIRILEAAKRMKEPYDIEFYLAMVPKLMYMLEKVTQHFNIPNLVPAIKKMVADYDISSVNKSISEGRTQNITERMV